MGAYSEGRMAYFDGQSLWDNPYDEESGDVRQAEDWDEGYMDAEDEETYESE